MKRLLRVFPGFLCMILLLGNSQCQSAHSSSGSNADPATSGSSTPALVTSLQVQDANGNAGSSFAMGEAIQFQLSVHNRSSSAQTVALAVCGADDNYVVLNAAGSTPQWDALSHGVQCNLRPIPPLVLQAGDTRNFTILWNQTDDQGKPMPAGSYEAMGGITCNSDTAPDGGGCMATLDLSGAQLTPSAYRSTLVAFTIH